MDSATSLNRTFKIHDSHCDHCTHVHALCVKGKKVLGHFCYVCSFVRLRDDTHTVRKLNFCSKYGLNFAIILSIRKPDCLKIGKADKSVTVILYVATYRFKNT